MSFWKKPDEPPIITSEDNPFITNTYPGIGRYSVDAVGGSGGSHAAPAQLGGSGKLSTSIYSNNTITAGTFAPVGFTDHIIQGEMIVAEYSVDTHEARFVDDDHIKRLLINEMVEKMRQGRYIEFTKQNDPVTNSIKCRARIYVTPDSHVKILRTFQNDNKR